LTFQNEPLTNLGASSNSYLPKLCFKTVGTGVHISFSDRQMTSQSSLVMRKYSIALYKIAASPKPKESNESVLLTVDLKPVVVNGGFVSPTDTLRFEKLEQSHYLIEVCSLF
jgi:hypothetical protein